MSPWWKKKSNSGVSRNSSFSKGSLKSCNSESSYNGSVLSCEQEEFELSRKDSVGAAPQCIQTFLKWTNWILFHEFDTKKGIKTLIQFKDPDKIAILLKKLTGNNPLGSKVSECRDKNLPFSGVFRGDRKTDLKECIEFIEQQRSDSSTEIAISQNDILEGKPGMILKLIWLIIVRFRLEAVSKSQLAVMESEDGYGDELKNIAGYNLFLQYCNHKLELYRQEEIIEEIKDFSTSWKNGVALLCLVHRYVESAVPGLTKYIYAETPSTYSSHSNTNRSQFLNAYGLELNADSSSSGSLSNFERTSVDYIKKLLFSGDKQMNAECADLALNLANKYLNVPMIVSASQFTEGNDELSILAYLSEFFWIVDLADRSKLIFLKEKSSEFANQVDKLVSSYVKNASMFLDIILDITTKTFKTTQAIKEKDSNFELEKSDWFYPIIERLNDPYVPLEKIRKLANKILRLIETKLMEALDEKKVPSSAEKRCSVFNIWNKDEIPIFSVFNMVSRLKANYNEILTFANSNDPEMAKMISQENLSNLSFLQEQVNGQLEDFAYNSFACAKTEMMNYMSYLQEVSIELSSFEEEVIGTSDKCGGMLREATRTTSEIKELGINITRKNNSITTQDSLSSTCSPSPCSTLTRVRYTPTMKNSTQMINNSENDMSMSGTLVNSDSCRICRSCSEWLSSSPANRLQLIFYTIQEFFNVLKKKRPDKKEYSCFPELTLGDNKPIQAPQLCCLKKLIINDNYSTGLRSKPRELMGSDYNSDMYSRADDSGKLAALVLTAQNIIFRATEIVDILKARFPHVRSPQRPEIENGKVKYSSSVIILPESLRERLEKVIRTAEIQIIQSLRSQVSVACKNRNKFWKFGFDGTEDLDYERQSCARLFFSDIERDAKYWGNVLEYIRDYCNDIVIANMIMKQIEIDSNIADVENSIFKALELDTKQDLEISLLKNLISRRSYTTTPNIIVRIDHLDRKIRAINNLWANIKTEARVKDERTASVSPHFFLSRGLRIIYNNLSLFEPHNPILNPLQDLDGLKFKQKNIHHSEIVSETKLKVSSSEILTETEYLVSSETLNNPNFTTEFGAEDPIKIVHDENEQSEIYSERYSCSIEIKRSTDTIQSPVMKTYYRNSLTKRISIDMDITESRTFIGKDLESINRHSISSIQSIEKNKELNRTSVYSNILPVKDIHSLNEHREEYMHKLVDGSCNKTQDVINNIVHYAKCLHLEIKDVDSIVELEDKLADSLNSIISAGNDLCANLIDASGLSITDSIPNYEGIKYTFLEECKLDCDLNDAQNIIGYQASKIKCAENTLSQVESLFNLFKAKIELTLYVSRYAKMLFLHNKTISEGLDTLLSNISNIQVNEALDSIPEPNDIVSEIEESFSTSIENLTSKFEMLKLIKIIPLEDNGHKILEEEVIRIMDALLKFLSRDCDSIASKINLFDSSRNDLKLAKSIDSAIQTLHAQIESDISIERNIIIPQNIIRVSPKSDSEHDGIIEWTSMFQSLLINNLDRNLIGESLRREFRRTRALEEIGYAYNSFTTEEHEPSKIWELLKHILDERIKLLVERKNTLSEVSGKTRSSLETHNFCANKIESLKNNLSERLCEITNEIDVYDQSGSHRERMTFFCNTRNKLDPLKETVELIKNELSVCNLSAKAINSMLLSHEGYEPVSNFDESKSVASSKKIYGFMMGSIDRIANCIESNLVLILEDEMRSIHETLFSNEFNLAKFIEGTRCELGTSVKSKSTKKDPVNNNFTVSKVICKEPIKDNVLYTIKAKYKSILYSLEDADKVLLCVDHEMNELHYLYGLWVKSENQKIQTNKKQSIEKMYKKLWEKYIAIALDIVELNSLVSLTVSLAEYSDTAYQVTTEFEHKVNSSISEIGENGTQVLQICPDFFDLCLNDFLKISDLFLYCPDIYTITIFNALWMNNKIEALNTLIGTENGSNETNTETSRNRIIDVLNKEKLEFEYTSNQTKALICCIYYWFENTLKSEMNDIINKICKSEIQEETEIKNKSEVLIHKLEHAISNTEMCLGKLAQMKKICEACTNEQNIDFLLEIDSPSPEENCFGIISMSENTSKLWSDLCLKATEVNNLALKKLNMLKWTKDYMQSFVLGMKSLTEQVKKDLEDQEFSDKKTLTGRSDLVNCWEEMIRAWTTRCEKVLNQSVLDFPEDSLNEQNFIENFKIDSQIYSMPCYQALNNHLTRIENNRSLFLQSELKKALTEIVQETIKFELNSLKEIPLN